MRILLTGATGFVGRALLPLLADRHEIVALARGPAPREPNGLADWIAVDLSRPLDSSLLPEQVDAVIHLAQSDRYRDFPEGAQDVFGVNVHGTFQLLEYARCAGATRFVFSSSGGVYGYGYERLAETTPVSPINFYLSSKYAGELLVGSYASLFRTVVLRFFFVYGPGQTRMLVPTLAEKVVSGERVVIEGDPGIRVNPIYVEDAVRVFEPALALDRGGLFNIAGNEVVTMTDLVELIAEGAGGTAAISHVDSAAPGDLIGDHTRMVESLGVSPGVGLREGLARVVEALTPARGSVAGPDPPDIRRRPGVEEVH